MRGEKQKNVKKIFLKRQESRGQVGELKKKVSETRKSHNVITETPTVGVGDTTKFDTKLYNGHNH